MRWYSTKKAAQMLGVTPSRVRQLVSKHRSDSALVSSDSVGNLVSQTLIDAHLKNHVSNAATSEIYTAEFSPSDYNEFKRRLSEYPILLDRVNDYRKEIDYLRRSLDGQASQMDKIISTMNKSMEALTSALENTHREQALKYIEKNSD
jgi:predicted transcriptional regulator